MLAALVAVLLVRSDVEAVESYKKTLSTFEALAHRVQKVHTWRGVDFYDDSKATNVGAVAMALASFDRPVILIAGGRDKQGDYAPLKGLVHHKVKKLFLLGEAKWAIEKVLKDQTAIELVEDMKEAVQKSVEIAQENDVVLLSPACSSYDQYRNYKERGDDFAKWAHYFCEKT